MGKGEGRDWVREVETRTRTRREVDFTGRVTETDKGAIGTKSRVGVRCRKRSYRRRDESLLVYIYPSSVPGL